MNKISKPICQHLRDLSEQVNPIQRLATLAPAFLIVAILIFQGPKILIYTGVFVATAAATFFLNSRWKQMEIHWLRVKGLLHKAILKLAGYLEHPIKILVPVTFTQLWNDLQMTMSETLIKTPDIRTTHWMLTAADENQGTMEFELCYMRQPLGTKAWRMYPRRILCTAELIGRGVRTEVQLTYHAQSAMDYPIVFEIINTTNAAIEKILPNDKESTTRLRVLNSTTQNRILVTGEHSPNRFLGTPKTGKNSITSQRQIPLSHQTGEHNIAKAPNGPQNNPPARTA